MKSIKNIRIQAPICLGDVISRKIGGTQADLVATKNVSQIEKSKKAVN